MSRSDVSYGRCQPMKEVSHVLQAAVPRTTMTPVAQVKPMQMVADRSPVAAISGNNQMGPRKRLVVRSLLTGNLVKFPVPRGGQFGSMPSIVPIPRPAVGAPAGHQLFQVVAQSSKKTFLIPYPVPQPAQAGSQCTTSLVTTTAGSTTLSASTVMNSAPRISTTCIQSKTSRGTPVQAVSPTPTPDSNNSVRRFIILNRTKDNPNPKLTEVTMGNPDVLTSNKRSIMTMLQIPQSDYGGAVPDSPLVVSGDSSKNAPKVPRYSSQSANIPSKDSIVLAPPGVPKSIYGVRPTSEPIRNIFTTSTEVTDVQGSSKSSEKTATPSCSADPEMGPDNFDEAKSWSDEKNDQFGEEDSELSIKIDSVFSLSGKSSEMAAAAPPLSPEGGVEGSDTDSVSGDEKINSSDVDENIRSAQKAVEKLQLEHGSSGLEDDSGSDSSEGCFSISGDYLTSADFEHLPDCLPNLPKGIELRFREARSQKKERTSSGNKQSTSPIRADNNDDLLDSLFNVISQDVTIPDAVPFPGPVKSKQFCKRTARKSCTGRILKRQTARKSCTGVKYETSPSGEEVGRDGEIASGRNSVRNSPPSGICPCGGRCQENECSKSTEQESETLVKSQIGRSVRDKHSTVLKLLIGDEPPRGKTEEHSQPQWTPTLLDVSGTSILAKPPGFWINVQPRPIYKQTLQANTEQCPQGELVDTAEDDSPPLELKISDVVSLRNMDDKDESVFDMHEKVIFPKKKKRKKRKPKKKEIDRSQKKTIRRRVKKLGPPREPVELPVSDDSDDIPLIAYKNCSEKQCEKNKKSELNSIKTEDIKKEEITCPSELYTESPAVSSPVSDRPQHHRQQAKRARKTKQKLAKSVDTPSVDTSTLSELTSNDEVTLALSGRTKELVSQWPRRRGRFCKRGRNDKSSQGEKVQLLSSSGNDVHKGSTAFAEQVTEGQPQEKCSSEIRLETPLDVSPPVNAEPCHHVGDEVGSENNAPLSTETTQTVAATSAVLNKVQSSEPLGRTSPVAESVDNNRTVPSVSPLDRIQRLKEQLRQQEEALAALRREREEQRSVLDGFDL